MQGSEAKDMLLGHIFGLAAVVQAGRVQDMAVRKQVATQLLLLGGKKAFVQEVAVGIFLQIAGMITSLLDAVFRCVSVNGPLAVPRALPLARVECLLLHIISPPQSRCRGQHLSHKDGFWGNFGVQSLQMIQTLGILIDCCSGDLENALYTARSAFEATGASDVTVDGAASIKPALISLQMAQA